MRFTGLSLLLCATLSAAAPGQRPKAAAKTAIPKAKPAREAAPAPVKPAEAPVPRPPGPDSALADFGAGLVERGSSLLVAEALPGSPAQELRLQAGDRLLAMNGASVRSRAEAAAAFRAWTPGTRLSALVLRGLRAVSLEGEQPEPQPSFKRGPSELSAHEGILKESRLQKASEDAQELFKKAPPLDFRIRAGQGFWLSFPQGIKEDAAPGDILLGELTTAVAASPELDFMVLPPGTQVWARVVESKASRETRSLRLLLFKARPEGGRYYPIAARITGILSDQRLSRVSPGGVIVTATALPGDEKSPYVLGPEVSLKAELLRDLILQEPPQFYRSGPGLWLRAREDKTGRRLEIARVVAGRSAEKEGLKPGQVLAEINGKDAAKLEFGAALSQLYGSPGSEVKIAVVKETGKKPETVALPRGVAYQEGKAVPLPLPIPEPD